LFSPISFEMICCQLKIGYSLDVPRNWLISPPGKYFGCGVNGDPFKRCGCVFCGVSELMRFLSLNGKRESHSGRSFLWLGVLGLWLGVLGLDDGLGDVLDCRCAGCLSTLPSLVIQLIIYLSISPRAIQPMPRSLSFWAGVL
jgi:hypothetical protein